MVPSLLKIIRESIKAVPAMKYALAVAGILAVVAMVGAFKVSPQTAVLGAVVTLALMVAMVVFARLTTTAPRHFFLPVQIMMWAFLSITVATAVLLFTSAFFQWPRGLRELMDRKPAPVTAAAPVARTPPTTSADQSELRTLITAAQQARTSRDYPGAWTTIGRAVALRPQSTEARDAQVQIAMAWIRDISIREGETFSNVLRPLTECLRLNVDNPRGNIAADVYAHLGWANFIREAKEQVAGLKVEDDFTSAIAREGANPYAHVMWARVLASRRRPLYELKAHFVLALNSGRDRAYVQSLRVASLLAAGTAEATAELLLASNEMRHKGDPLDLSIRQKILWELYTQFGRSDEIKLLSLLAPADHLLTFKWLLEEMDVEQNADYSYFYARLTEAFGDDVQAAERYRKLVAQDISAMERAKAGLARCEQRIAARKK